MKVWITKYALTKGILVCDAEIIPGDTVEYAKRGGLFTREFARTAAEALEMAERMKAKRIASLKKALRKLEKTAGFPLVPWPREKEEA